jgi:hypothetical protein
MLPDDLYPRLNPTTDTKDSAPVKPLSMTPVSKDTTMVIIGGKHHLVDPNVIPFFRTLMASRPPGSERISLMDLDFGTVSLISWRWKVLDTDITKVYYVYM